MNSKKSSFWSEYLDLFNIYSSPNEATVNNNGFEQDLQNLTKDWQNIGIYWRVSLNDDDMRECVKKV